MKYKLTWPWWTLLWEREGNSCQLRLWAEFIFVVMRRWISLKEGFCKMMNFFGRKSLCYEICHEETHCKPGKQAWTGCIRPLVFIISLVRWLQFWYKCNGHPAQCLIDGILISVYRILSILLPSEFNRFVKYIDNSLLGCMAQLCFYYPSASSRLYAVVKVESSKHMKNYWELLQKFIRNNFRCIIFLMMIFIFCYWSISR